MPYTPLWKALTRLSLVYNSKQFDVTVTRRLFINLFATLTVSTDVTPPDPRSIFKHTKLIASA